MVEMVGKKLAPPKARLTRWGRPESLPEEERWQPIKCFFAHDALVHPEHPFHPGKEGIELFIGK